MLPSELKVIQNSACNFTGEEFLPNYSCRADSLLNTITVRNFLSGSSLKGELISLQVNSIRNPVDYISPGDLEISFETPSGGIIAQGKWGEWTTEYSSSKIDQFLVRAEDETVGLLNVTYSFVVIPRGQVA